MHNKLLDSGVANKSRPLRDEQPASDRAWFKRGIGRLTTSYQRPEQPVSPGAAVIILYCILKLYPLANDSVPRLWTNLNQTRSRR